MTLLAKRQLSYAAGILLRRPFQVLVQVTNRCNMRCPFCGFWENGTLPEKELALDDFRRLASELSELGCFLVSIEGGEPFLRPDLVDIVRAFSEKHLPLLYTNGWYVERGNAEALFAAGLTQVGVSIDFADAARHDAMRGPSGAWEKAWRAVERLRDAAPHRGKQVHVMTVLMQENRADLPRLLEMTERLEVGHTVTLLSASGVRRGSVGTLPAAPISEELLRLWRRFPHFRIFRHYLKGIDRHLERREMPSCLMGVQGFNVDHLGNVSRCIEKIADVEGNVRKERLGEIHERIKAAARASRCQDCWTVCRGYTQALGNGGRPDTLWDLSSRMRSA